MEAREIRRIARENLAGNWGNAVLVAFLAALLGGLLTGSSFSLDLSTDDLEFVTVQYPQIQGILTVFIAATTGMSFVHFILGGVIRQGYAVYLLKHHDRKDPQTNDLFSQFDRFGDGFSLALFQGLFILLWTLLLIFPGIMKCYAYAMAPFIMAENPDLTARECLKASETMMDGHKAELFFLELSFLGWGFLAALTLGIGYLWLNPYMNSAYAAFYRKLRRPKIEA